MRQLTDTLPWEQIAKQVGFEPSAETRTYLEQSYGDEWRDPDMRHPDMRDETVRLIVGEVLRLRDHGLEKGDTISLASSASGSRTARWDLLARLIEKAGGALRDPMTIGIRPNRFDEQNPLVALLQDERVAVEFPASMSLKDVEAELRRTWPSLRSLGVGRSTRPMQPKTLRLIEFVCLECSPGMTWAERYEGWQQHEKRWPYPTRRSFRTAVGNAAEALIGRRDGLRAFCDEGAWRELAPAAVLRDLAAEGDETAGALLVAREFDRRLRQITGSVPYSTTALAELSSRAELSEAERSAVLATITAGYQRRAVVERRKLNLNDIPAVRETSERIRERYESRRTQAANARE